MTQGKKKEVSEVHCGTWQDIKDHNGMLAVGEESCGKSQ